MFNMFNILGACWKKDLHVTENSCFGKNLNDDTMSILLRLYQRRRKLSKRTSTDLTCFCVDFGSGLSGLPCVIASFN